MVKLLNKTMESTGVGDHLEIYISAMFALHLSLKWVQFAPHLGIIIFISFLLNWCLNRHLCILPERFAKKDLNLVIVCRKDVMS